ncbi:hypothetical protein Cgig2_033128 [Carnegiea gigantea]|uniref:RRM domain-containing protein n=1 Tax=Carnegiea gigantea TaxID=171969 RepID=A0A9Q1H012_9CARY|nr:hypothetical protein Cgig2_033128 [Carnegiea gigantea]
MSKRERALKSQSRMPDREKPEQKGHNVGQREFPIFVNNIPEEIDQYGLKGIFQKAGRICDVYIPHRRTRRAKLRGRRIAVAMAKFEQNDKTRRKQRIHRQQSKLVWGRKENQHRVEAEGNHTKQTQVIHRWTKTVTGEINSDFEEWLRRSLLCTTEVPRDLATLSSAILSGYGQCTKICALSSFKYILTYPTEVLMEEALNNHEELDVWFHDIQRWSSYDTCKTRNIWLEVYGVPPRGGYWENFKWIGELWGKLITLGKPIFRTDSFESMKVFIATEIGSATHQYIPVHRKNSEVHESTSQPLGFEDIEEDQADEYCNNMHSPPARKGANEVVLVSPDMEFSSYYNNRHSPHSRIVANEVVQESLDMEFSSNLNCVNQKSQHNSSDSPNARTKTANFSNNGYSDEVLKISQHSKSLGVVMSYPPPGIVTEGIIDANEMEAAYKPNDWEKEVQPMGEDECTSPLIGELEPPPGFEKVSKLIKDQRNLENKNQKLKPNLKRHAKSVQTSKSTNNSSESL